MQKLRTTTTSTITTAITRPDFLPTPWCSHSPSSRRILLFLGLLHTSSLLLLLLLLLRRRPRRHLAAAIPPTLSSTTPMPLPSPPPLVVLLLRLRHLFLPRPLLLSPRRSFPERPTDRPTRRLFLGPGLMLVKIAIRRGIPMRRHATRANCLTNLPRKGGRQSRGIGFPFWMANPFMGRSRSDGARSCEAITRGKGSVSVRPRRRSALFDAVPRASQ